MTKRLMALVALVFAGIWLPRLATADSPLSALDGKMLFARNCVACHGEAARGDGRMASAFVNPPPDLTQIALRRGGWFPEGLVTEIVDGRLMAHGGRVMPVWGGWLKPEEIAAIVDYLATLQEQGPPGKMLYQRYCVACHGPEGHGDAPVTSALRERPPDLTTISKRNEGWFPERRIQDIVDGRFPVHGRREMPVWGHLLNADELILLSEYLFSIQEP